MTTITCNLIKLSVGTETVAGLVDWQISQRHKYADSLPRHVTRMWPKRAPELLAGGSLYWVFKGVILARQEILRLDEVIGEDGIRRCGIIMSRQIIRTQSAPRRPFQGWRYLSGEDAPRDLELGRPAEDSLPPELASALADIGIR